MLINEAMARRYWPGENPAGQQIVIGEDLGPETKEPPRQIVGIVDNFHNAGLGRPAAPAMQKFGITYPIALDSNQAIWNERPNPVGNGHRALYRCRVVCRGQSCRSRVGGHGEVTNGILMGVLWPLPLLNATLAG